MSGDIVTEWENIQRCPKCGVPGEGHTDIIQCADAQIAYYQQRCSCGAPEPCTAPRYGGQHVPEEIWMRWEIRELQ